MFVIRPSSIAFHTLASAASLAFLLLFIGGCAGYSPKQSAAVSVSSSALDFQKVTVGQKSAQTLKISNTGIAPLQITALSVSSKQFSVAGPAAPQTIAPAETVSYSITFAPTSTGSATATVTISTSADIVPTSVSLKGSGEKAYANLVINPTAISFGNLALTSKATQNVTVQNTGDINLSLQGITLSGAGFGYADLSPGFSLAPNQKVTFQVWFSPKVVGPASATLTLLSPSLTSPGTLSLSGDGVSSSTPPPTNPTPTVQHTVALSWMASTSSVIGYRVYRSETAGGSYSPLNGTALTAVTYTDSTVASGTTYYYVVTAVDSAGTESLYSNQVTAVIPTP